METQQKNLIAYVVKRYPRFSETFIVNEILAHEASGARVVIFALGCGMDEAFQPALAFVKAPVHYIGARSSRATDFWAVLRRVRPLLDRPGVLAEILNEEPSSVLAAAELALAVQKLGVTHLHAHFATSATTVARLASKMTGVPYSFTAHAKDIFHDSVQQDDLERKFRDASTVVTVSQFNLDYLNGLFGHLSTPIRRVYNGLPLRDFPFNPPNRRLRRILSVGRLVEKKGFGDLIDACAILRTRGIEFECDIVGSGELEETLGNQIDRLVLGGNVRLLGSRPQQEVKQLLSQSAVFAAPCVVGEDGNRDGLPTVLLEAMAIGTPCVATDVTGIPEVIIDGVTGHITPQRDPSALADRLELLLDDAHQRVRLAENARVVIDESFDSRKSARMLRACFGPTTSESIEVAA